MEGNRWWKKDPESEDKRTQRAMRALKAIHSRYDSLDLDGHRAAQDLMGKVFHPLTGYTFEPFSIKGMPCAWIRPEHTHGNRHCVLYFHGGGYTTGNLSYARILGSKLAAATRFDVLAVEYRLAPEFAFPSQLDDGEKAWDYLMYLGYGAKDVVVAGESAGGNLALSLPLRLKKQNRKMPGALVCMSPWTDLTMSGESFTACKDLDPILTPEYISQVREMFTRGHEIKDPLVSPLFGDFAGFPPTLIQVGSNEILLSDSLELHRKMLGAQVYCKLQVWDDMWHVFQMFPSKKAAEAMEGVARFIFDQI